MNSEVAISSIQGIETAVGLSPSINILTEKINRITIIFQLLYGFIFSYRGYYSII